MHRHGQVVPLVMVMAFGACRGHGAKGPSDGKIDRKIDGKVVLVPGPLHSCDDVKACQERCQKGSGDDCLALGHHFSMGQGSALDEPRALRLFEQACARNNTSGCIFAGRMYEYAHGVARDEKQALSLYERACTADDLAGCYNVAVMLENGRGTARDQARAAALYQRVCEKKSSAACAGAERLASYQPGQPR
jgi:TPR repeat protein